jgi:hypothetical protein
VKGVIDFAEADYSKAAFIRLFLLAKKLSQPTPLSATPLFQPPRLIPTTSLPTTITFLFINSYIK